MRRRQRRRSDTEKKRFQKGRARNMQKPTLRSRENPLAVSDSEGKRRSGGGGGRGGLGLLGTRLAKTTNGLSILPHDSRFNTGACFREKKMPNPY